MSLIKINLVIFLLLRRGEKIQKKIANKIIEFRKKKKITTTTDLVNLIKQVNTYKKKHPATKSISGIKNFRK